MPFHYASVLLYDGNRDVMQALDGLLSSFVVQQRMKLPGSKYVPCYRIRGT